MHSKKKKVCLILQQVTHCILQTLTKCGFIFICGSLIIKCHTLTMRIHLYEIMNKRFTCSRTKEYLTISNGVE